ncbi:hypothetical protein B0T10DRAFT_547492 [Thelonectria olida]|uniref:Uncharacterized protein n=1 Tax=Thelonectria olida TaxID=1576542 RepID=A0A9P8W5U4_9HYPO|nr:hypothetical protein B0T10DRAFT_547492 [Thelonectria olida]
MQSSSHFPMLSASCYHDSSSMSPMNPRFFSSEICASPLGISAPTSSSSSTSCTRLTPPTSPGSYAHASTAPTSPGHSPAASSAPASPRACSSIVFGEDDVYPTNAVPVMAASLWHAREAVEMPTTTTSPKDAQAVVADYEALKELRLRRGCMTGEPPEAYNKFRVEISRKIEARDGAGDDSGTEEEAARRVDSYLRLVGQEHHFFDKANTPVSQHRSGVDMDQFDHADVGENLCNIVEHTIEQTMADATGPLRMNIVTLKDQSATLGRQIDMHHRAVDQQSAVNAALVSLVEQQSAANTALMSMIAPQADNLHSTSSQVNLVTNQLATVNDQLEKVDGLVRSLTDVLANLSPATSPVTASPPTRSYTADDGHQTMLECQQQMLADIQQQSRLLQNMATEVRAGRVVKLPTQPNPRPWTPPTSRPRAEKTKGGVRRMMNKVFH